MEKWVKSIIKEVVIYLTVGFIVGSTFMYGCLKMLY